MRNPHSSQDPEQGLDNLSDVDFGDYSNYSSIDPDYNDSGGVSDESNGELSS